MKHKLLFRRFFASLLLLAVSTISWAYDFEVDGIYYNRNSDGTSVTVTYKDENYNSYSGTVVIPSSVVYNEQNYVVTSIGGFAFYGCSGLTSVTIPNSVMSIGRAAFCGCSGLTSITIPNSVTSIGNYAFKDCSGLTSFTIPNSVTSIGGYTFSGCSGLTSITIPNSVTSIGELAFASCSGLTSITIPESVTSIGSYAFNDCCPGLTSITVASGNTKYDSRNNCNAIIETATNTLVVGCKETVIPEGVTSIGGSAFFGCSGLTSVTIPNSVTSIGSVAFGGCSKLTSVTIPNTVTSIGYSAFECCSALTSVTIPNSVTSIGAEAFLGCSRLTSVIINSNVVLSKNYSWDFNLKNVFGEQVKEYVIGNDVTSIGFLAFYGCSGLTSIAIPNSVTSIGSYAFSGCSGLTSITVASGNTKYDSRNDCNAIVETVSNTLIVGCKNTTIPNSVTSIGVGAFRGCSGLTTINIPEGVTSIGNYAFYNCSGLTTINIPEGVTSIGDSTFSKCNFRTIVSKPIQPKGFPDTFSQPEYNHTMLYVPQNSYWDYVFNSEWYRFLHIKEFAVDEVEARQAYMLADTDGTNFTVYNAASDKLVTKEYMHQVDETNLGSNWVAEPCGAGVALLNLGAEKYAQISSDGKISLSDTPQELDIKFSDGVATANGRQMMLVLNDDDDITDVVTLRYTPTASEDSFNPNAPIYDLMGRRLQQKPASGYYIQGGKKYLVK